MRVCGAALRVCAIILDVTGSRYQCWLYVLLKRPAAHFERSCKSAAAVSVKLWCTKRAVRLCGGSAAGMSASYFFVKRRERIYPGVRTRLAWLTIQKLPAR